jgi:hypothetical protein
MSPWKLSRVRRLAARKCIALLHRVHRRPALPLLAFLRLLPILRPIALCVLSRAYRANVTSQLRFIGMVAVALAVIGPAFQVTLCSFATDILAHLIHLHVLDQELHYTMKEIL